MTDKGRVTEPANSTVDDWMGQEVDRDRSTAEQAMAEAGGDERKAEEIFDRRTAANDPEAVPSVPEERRPG